LLQSSLAAFKATHQVEEPTTWLIWPELLVWASFPVIIELPVFGLMWPTSNPFLTSFSFLTNLQHSTNHIMVRLPVFPFLPQKALLSLARFFRALMT